MKKKIQVNSNALTHLSQAGDIPHRRPIGSYPDDVRGGAAPCRTFHLGAGSVGEIDAVRGFLDEHGP